VFSSDPYEAASSCDALLILTEWQEFARLDLPKVRSLLKYPVVIDGRNLYEPQQMANAGLIYHSIGRGVGVPQQMSSAAHGADGEVGVEQAIAIGQAASSGR
jgi:hypothetical protein